LLIRVIPGFQLVKLDFENAHPAVQNIHLGAKHLYFGNKLGRIGLIDLFFAGADDQPLG
jgi:hypothetical protein